MSIESLKTVEKYYLELADFLNRKGVRKSFDYELMVYRQMNLYDYIKTYFVGEQSTSFNCAAITHAFQFVRTERGASFWVDIHHEWIQNRTKVSMVKEVPKFNSIW
jgi:hypothetical protein